MEIVLMRHGNPGFRLDQKVNASQIHQLVDEYNASGIVDSPPAKAFDKAKQCKVVVCSQWLRSTQSAYALGFEKVVLSDSLFREAELPYLPWMPLTFSPIVWVLFFRALWYLGLSTNGESIAITRQRAKSASLRLIAVAREHESVIFVGHGFINRFIAQALLSQGWAGPVEPGKNHWDFASYKRIAT